jgi:hypothetical protein
MTTFSEPLHAFVHDARVRLALVLESSGQVLAQHGFTRSLDVMSACSLAAAIHASAAELGRELGGTAFGPLHHAGDARQLFLAPVLCGGRTILLLAVFDGASSLGMVRLFWAEFAHRVGDAMAPRVRVQGTDFERDLEHNLDALFGGV